MWHCDTRVERRSPKDHISIPKIPNPYPKGCNTWHSRHGWAQSRPGSTGPKEQGRVAKTCDWAGLKVIGGTVISWHTGILWVWVISPYVTLRHPTSPYVPKWWFPHGGGGSASVVTCFDGSTPRSTSFPPSMWPLWHPEADAELPHLSVTYHFFLPSKRDYIENPCLLMYLNACFMTPDHTTSTATDAFNLESGVDQVLLRQRGEELQRICDEILAQRPSAINGQPSHKSQKGHRGQRNGSAQKESGWLLACLLLARCRTCGWLGGLIHRTPRSGQIFGQNRSNPRCSYCLSCRFGSGVSHARVVLRFVVGLTLPYYVSRLVLWRAWLFSCLQDLLEESSVGLVTAHRPDLCDSVVAPGLCELSQLVRGWRFCYLSKSWCQGGDSSHAGAHRGWLRLGCHIAGLQKFKFERREISNDAGVLIGLASEQRQTSSGTPFLLPPGLEKRLLGNFLESSWGLLGQLLQTSVWAFRLFQRSKMSSVSSSQLCWACHRGSTKKQMLVYSLLYRPSTGDGGRLQHFLSQGYITHKSWRPLITLMYAAEWLLCARYGFHGMEMQPMRFISCVVHLFWICKWLLS